MQINPKLIKKQFEKSIDKYNENAFVQRILAEKLVQRLSDIKKDFNNILELGCGSGLLTNEINEHLNFKKYFANDLVDKSESYIKKIIPNATFYCGNALNINPTSKMNLVISNAMFQWFQDLEKVSNVYKNILDKDGILAFTSFTPENYKEIKELTGFSLNYKTSEEIKEIFSKNFKIIHIEETKHILKFDNPLKLLAHMKNTGVNSLNTKTWTFKEVKDFCEKYTNKYSEITLTYAGIIVICEVLK